MWGCDWNIASCKTVEKYLLYQPIFSVKIQIYGYANSFLIDVKCNSLLSRAGSIIFTYGGIKSIAPETYLVIFNYFRHSVQTEDTIF